MRKNEGMTPIYSILQHSVRSVFEDMWNSLKSLVITFRLFILIAVGLVILYVILTRVVLRPRVYKTAQKEPTCVLSMAGRERSLEYLEKFGGLTGLEIQVVKYLRKRRSVPYKKLGATFGEEVIQKLVKKGMVKVV